MQGIYLERDIIELSKITPRELQALQELGIKLEIDGDNQVVRILEDTSEQDHALCDDPDAAALVKSIRRRGL